ncbi:MAG TPA: D-alanyl-D-alanine endopeptidase [Smithella sp.]|nr:D-alanyl-D-alanine endopeptidase [Smithella sp.]HRS96716.1 D-alanyl-D-alanine endopeptidase [Smithella sp.]
MNHRYIVTLSILFLSFILAFPGIAEYSDTSSIKNLDDRFSTMSIEPSYPNLSLRSASVLVEDQQTGEYLIEKHPDVIVPIASITKLMTAMIILDARLNMKEKITITAEDVDKIRHSHSRLPVNTSLSRNDALLLALMSSENRAAHALARTYPQGLKAFVRAMNDKAQSLGLHETRFADPTGLSSENVSSARDLARMVNAAYKYELIRDYTTRKEYLIRVGKRSLKFCNTNHLVRNPQWQIGLSKTGFIDEAGRCLVMQSKVAQRPVLIVLLDADGKMTRYGDANRIKKWMEESLAGDS